MEEQPLYAEVQPQGVEHHLFRVPTPYLLVAVVLMFGSASYAMFSVFLGGQNSGAASVATLVPVSTPNEPTRVMAMGGHTATTTVEATVRILFVGDMFFDRQIRFVGTQQGVDYPFACIDPLLSSADFVVGNMEGPITSSPSVSFGTIPGSANNYRFTFPTTTAQTLYRHNVRAVSIGNNHILNFGSSGLASTKQYLDQASIGHFGGVAGDEQVYRTEYNGVPLSFVGYNEFGGSSATTVATAVAAEKRRGRVVIVFSHWGIEYATSPKTIRPVAKLFAAAGASVVVGAHPHVVGLHEQIGSTTVYYSLGNFIFDQYFSDAVQHGLAVMLTLQPTGVVAVEEYPLELKRNGQTCLVE